jgi:thioredoxin
MSLKLEKNTEFKVEYINNRQEWDDLTKSNKIIVCDFTANWCGPCKMIGPKFVKLAQNYSDNLKVEFLKIDVDKNEEVAALCEIECMPTFQVWYNGKKLETWTGASSENLKLIQQKIESILKQ